MTTKTIYIGTNDKISVTANTEVWDEANQKYTLVPIPFIDNETSKIQIEFADQVKNSTDDASIISFDNQGKISLSLGSLATVVKNRSHTAVVRAFDPEHPLGQTIIDPSRIDSNLSLIFK